MKAIFTISFILMTGLALFAQENLTVSGKITDKATGEPLPGVTILIKGTITGTATENDGSFSLKTKSKPPFVLAVSSIGYKAQEIEVKTLPFDFQVGLSAESALVDELVVSASRVEEKILKSPVAIEKLDSRALKDAPAPSFYDALANVKGVQMTTSSLTFKVPNTRGFNIPNNFRFMQLVDGVDMQAATLGVPLGNAIGPTELDIASIEITPGAASALYGLNAINGMANLQTKNPFFTEGISVYQKIGVNHVDHKDRPTSLLSETAIRIAKVYGKLAFKLNGSYLQGTDWLSSNYTDQNPQQKTAANPRFPTLSGDNNPAADLWNRYGDEKNNNIPVTVQYQGKTETFNVRRTGYLERDLTNPTVKNLKFDGSVLYKLSDKLELSYGYRFGQMDGVFQRGNKIQLSGVTVQNHRLELRSADFFIRSYMLVENTGKSYNLKPLADNLDLTAASNATWSSNFQKSLQASITQGVSLADAMKAARQVADQNRLIPGTAAFNELKSTIISTNNWDHASLVKGAPATGGAWLTQRSRTYHTDIQYDLSRKIKWASILLGADFRVYEVIPDGNNFVDFSRPLDQRTLPGGNHQYYKKVGGFVQVTKNLFNDKLKLVGSIRADYNPEFDPKINPRIAAVYSAGKNNFIRASWQNGYRFPALFEALSFVNNGNVRRVGGLARVNEGLGYLENSYTLASIDNFTAAVNAAVSAGTPKNQAALNNRNVLQVANLKPSVPEHINSYEVGYKSILFQNKIAIDFDAYYNVYDGFLGQVEVAVPKTDVVGTDASVLDMLTRANQTRYRVYTNAKNTTTSYGSSLGVTYQFFKKYTITANVNYNNIKTNSSPDVFVTGFNTPKWVSNVTFGNREIVKNFGANLVWHWQDAFLWESPLADGRVSAYSTIDGQVTYQIPAWHVTAKLGGSDLLNTRYIQYAAGPNLGALYYLALTWNIK
jgi:outer membrane receptor protein involved in Fe transport